MNPEKVIKTFEYFLLTQVSHPNTKTVVDAGKEHIKEMRKYLKELEGEK